MKAIVISILCIAVSCHIYGQNLSITFSGTGESTVVESIIATNLTTDESITLPGSETLILKGSTGIYDIDVSQDVQLYPNPFNGRTSVVLDQAESGIVFVSVTTIEGEVLVNRSENLNPGRHMFEISVGASGIYLIDIIGENRYTSKAVCLKPSESFQIRYIGQSELEKNMTKSFKESYELFFTPGDWIHYKGYSGVFITNIADSVDLAKNIEFEFVNCNDPDGRTYEAVMVGDQIWMAENLAYLPFVDYTDELGESSPYCFVYNYNGMDVEAAKATSEYKKYGGLYNWEAARSFCPTGWRLPLQQDWEILCNNIARHANHKLKEKDSWKIETNCKNPCQFNAIPSGRLLASCDDYLPHGIFEKENESAYFWTSSKTDYIQAWGFSLDDGIDYQEYVLTNGFSVRYIKDNPLVVTQDVINILDSSALLKGFYHYPVDSSEVAKLGFCWSEKNQPTIEDKVSENTPHDGSFNNYLSNLKPNTKYFIKAYITTIFGKTLYGNQLSFATADGSFSDERDNTLYGYIMIGNQLWMNRNLEYNVDHRDDNSNYGGSYYQDECPPGWILPSDDDWKDLELFLGMDSSELDLEGWRNSGSVGHQLKSSWGWDNGGNGNNSSRLDVRPAGTYSYWWGRRDIGRTTSFLSNNSEFGRGFETDSLGIDRIQLWRGKIRCIKKPPVSVITLDTTFNLRDTTITVFGEIVRNSDETDIKTKGFCWSTMSRPNVFNDTVISTGDSDSFSCVIRKLQPSTKYYLRAYATLSNGESFYGSDISFESYGGTLKDDRDGKEYLYIDYGHISWMVENLAYLPQIDDPKRGSVADPKYYVYDYWGDNLVEAKATANYNEFGVLYNWKSAQSACPEGWELPSDTTWLYLEHLLGLSYSEFYTPLFRESGSLGLKMKSATGWDDGQNGNNSSRFNALPGGYRQSTSNWFFYNGSDASLWTSTKYDQTNALHRTFFANFNGIGRLPYSVTAAFSVRCVKNSENQPIVITHTVEDFTDKTVSCSGELLDEGSSQVITKGFCWGKNENPNISGNHIELNFEENTFTAEIINLDPNTTYYVRAFASNQFGTSYGRQVKFRTVSGTFVDTRDNTQYPYVVIGTQTWMAANLKYLPLVYASTKQSNTGIRYYVYDYESNNAAEAKRHTNFKTYGVLYNWPSAMANSVSSNSNPSEVQGVCPEGWHLPSNDEWDVLEHSIRDRINEDNLNIGVGKSMASCSYWKSSLDEGAIGYNPENNNSSGFNGLPGGSLEVSGFREIGTYGSFWTTTESTRYENSAYARGLGYHNDRLRSFDWRGKSKGRSVRCIKD